MTLRRPTNARSKKGFNEENLKISKKAPKAKESFFTKIGSSLTMVKKEEDREGS